MQPHAETESRPRVCRRLFAEDTEAAPLEGGVRDNALNQISEQINRDLDDACKKYNFDFRAEVPLEGDWVWERIDHHPSERRVAQVPGDRPAAEPPAEAPVADTGDQDRRAPPPGL